MLRLCTAAADIEWLSGVLAECGRAVVGWWLGGSDNVAAEVSKTLNKRQCQHCQTENLTKHFPAWFVNLQSPTTERQDDRTTRLSAVLPEQKQKEIELSCEKNLNAIELRTQSNSQSHLYPSNRLSVSE